MLKEEQQNSSLKEEQQRAISKTSRVTFWCLDQSITFEFLQLHQNATTVNQIKIGVQDYYIRTRVQGDLGTVHVAQPVQKAADLKEQLVAWAFQIHNSTKDFWKHRRSFSNLASLTKSNTLLNLIGKGVNSPLIVVWDHLMMVSVQSVPFFSVFALDPEHTCPQCRSQSQSLGCSRKLVKG